MDAASAHVESLLRIYGRSIERSEQRPAQAIRAALADKRYTFLGAFIDGRLVGFASIYAWKRQGIWLLEYLAVDSRNRGGGIGGALVRACQDVAGRASLAVGLLEVDSEHGPKPREAARRLRFYAELGCRRVRGLDYLLPLRVRGVPPPMCMLALASTATKVVATSQMRRWLMSIYRDIYGLPGTDARVAAMLRGANSSLSLSPE